jgi:hypothetical protein
MGYEALVEDKTRHLRLLEITPSLILDLLKIDEARRVTINGRELRCVADAIPATATVASCGMNDYGNLIFHVADASFTPVPAQCLIPRISPQYRLDDE